MNFCILLSIGLCAYLLGAVPFGFLLAKTHGIDIRTVGSHNIGATNVLRILGKKCGIAAFVLDFAKGIVCAGIIPWLIHLACGIDTGVTPYERLTGGIFAVIGHNWPVYLGFKGGKGVATSAGMLFAITPAVVGIALAVWAVVVLISRIVSLGSICAALALGILVWIPKFFQGTFIASVLTALAVIVIVRHHANITRLINGTESRFSFGKNDRKANEK